MTTLPNANETYVYDGDGNRIEKLVNGSVAKIYWYGSGSMVLEETDGTGSSTNGNFSQYVFFGGARIARRDASGNVFYYVDDHLGSARVIVQAGQTTACYDADFYPFGGEIAHANTCPQNYKFTGKERDPETNLDNFGARYYNSGAQIAFAPFGRFLSADWSSVPVPVPYANLTNPQTLNLYAMVSDNPETFADLDGHWTAPYEWANWVDSKINAGVNYVQDKAIASGSPALAATATFASGVTGDVAKGFTNLLRTGESVGSLPSGASAGQIATAVAEEGGRVGGTILAVVAVAGPKTPATAESGAQVAGEIGKNRVTLDNGSQVDVAGKAHGGVDTPHIKDPTFNTNPQTGQVFQNKYGPVRPATVGDVNAAAKTAGATPPVRIPPPLPVPQPKKENQ